VQKIISSVKERILLNKEFDAEKFSREMNRKVRIENSDYDVKLSDCTNEYAFQQQIVKYVMSRNRPITLVVRMIPQELSSEC
jgi:hypothetical protein